jgi:hypothetical protein
MNSASRANQSILRRVRSAQLAFDPEPGNSNNAACADSIDPKPPIALGFTSLGRSVQWCDNEPDHGTD